MALAAGEVLQLPDLACIGMVKDVRPMTESQTVGSPYWVLPIEIKAKYAGKDGLFFLLSELRWFRHDFDPASLLNEGQRGITSYRMYRQMVNDAKKVSALKALVGPENWDAFVVQVDQLGNPDAVEIAELIRQAIVGNEVLYVCYQRLERGTNERLEQYNIKYFLEPTTENVTSLIKMSKDPKRRRGSLVLTFEHEHADYRFGTA